MKTKKDVEGLIKALKYKKEFKVRAEAAWELGKIGDSTAVEPLIRALKDIHWTVRKKAAIALRNVGEPAVKPLIQALKDKDNVVLWRLAIALGKIGDKRAIKPLKQILNEDWDVQKAAREALERIEKK